VAPKPVRIQREGAQLQIRGTWSAGPGDDQARFLADLRALRDSAAIGYDELAARAHYPSDILKEAENGPSLPGLPILTAFVRACEGDVPDWEERWRRLNPEVRDDPSLPVRPAGASAAAVAGARAGIGVAPPDVYDPDRIKAALRGDQARSGQARSANDPGVSVPAVSSAGLQSPDQGPPADPGTSTGGWAATPDWDATPHPGVTTANGNHTAHQGNRGPFDAVITSMPETAEPAPAGDFSWLQKSTTESQAAEGELTWPERTDNGKAAAPADDSFWSRPGGTEAAAEPADGGFWSRPGDTGSAAEPADGSFWSKAGDTGSITESADTDLTWPERPGAGLATGSVASGSVASGSVPPGSVLPEPDITERLPRHQADLTSEERTDFWSRSAPAAPADVRMPATPARADEPAVTGASWSATADTAAPAPAAPQVAASQAAAPQVAEPPVAEQARRGVAADAADAEAAAAASTHPLSAPALPPRPTAGDPDSRRPDRFFPVRLLVVIVIAALIGSALVLLLK
jgi:hypothetical protein